ncbi:MAG: leucine--tRNA ligase [Chloroflexi bacterium]|nr:leucine--tRNA ligase [Chloroflexota bacterium]
MNDIAPYNPQTIEPQWQQRWDEAELYRSKVDWDKPKHYALTMLPYPSGDLHIGHWFAMTPSDARARYKRMRGFNVLFPMGFDAFGLPAENAAVQRGIHPATWTYANMDRMRRQLRSMGAMFDWSREMVSCDPAYYKWTEWFFKTFYNNDLAYRGKALVNWSPTLQTVLANEQVIDGKDERTGQPVIQKMMTQWFFRYTRYADEMLDFSDIDWPEPVRIMQTNWIGRSEGAHVTFHALTPGPSPSGRGGDSSAASETPNSALDTQHSAPGEGRIPITVYTTRPDTLWGATFMVLAPEHPLVAKITTDVQRAEVEAYVEAAAHKTEIERSAEDREKTGVFTGAYAINPVNDARIPIWIADYVMISYGSGAIMAVPAHDGRDFAFARKFGLKVVPVIQPEGETFDGDTMTEAWPYEGVMINSGPFNGTPVTREKGRKNPAINAVIDWLEARGIGKEAVNYRLRDWLISRQRYWGSPIPVIYTQDGTIELAPDDKLPVELPQDVEMTGYGNPLAQHETFVHTVDSQGRPARRETDTMDTFMCSSWYHLRYLSPGCDVAPFSADEAAYWLPVDTYTGGTEHATMHLLYTRWFNKALRDTGVFDDTFAEMKRHGRDPRELNEPMLQLRNQGQILGEQRPGDLIVASGRIESNRKMFADHVRVVPSFDGQISTEVYWGELIKRTENLLTLETPDGSQYTVEVVDGATVEIPSIPGPNTVNQLKHHLDVERMSKSRGNVVNPDELVAEYGADTVRAYLMFAFDFMKGGPWDSQGIQGVVRWLNDMWEIVQASTSEAGDPAAERALERRVYQAIERVTYSLEAFSFNTAVAALMGLRNDLKTAVREGKIGTAAFRDAIHIVLRLMAPITPHIAEELWAKLGWPFSIHTQPWPEYDAAKAAEEVVPLVVMVNGRVRGHVEVAADISEDGAKAAALDSEWVVRQLDGAQPKRVIFIGGREPKVNVVV